MITQKDFLFYTNDFKEHPNLPGTIIDPPKAHIICENSFKNNIDIKKFINNLCTKNEIQNLIKTCFTFNEIITLNNLSKGFYVVSENRLSTLLKGIKVKFSSNIGLLEINGEKILYFSNEYKFISFKPKKEQSQNNHIINQFNNLEQKPKAFLNQTNSPFNNNNFGINQQISQNNKKNLALSTLNDDKSKIIKILILLYANEKETMRLYSQGCNESNLKNYYLINKEFFHKFKKIYNYNSICNIPEIKGITNFIDCYKKITILEQLNQVKNIYNTIIIDPYIFSHTYPNPSVVKIGYEGEYEFPTDFLIIHELIIKLLKQFVFIEMNTEYEIKFGKQSLCIRLNKDKNKIYIYNYSNNTFNLSGIIDLFADACDYIYNKHLSKKTFLQYLSEKKINISLIDQKQELFSSGNVRLGYIYLHTQLQNTKNQSGNMMANQNILINESPNLNLNIAKNVDFNFIYNKWMNSINGLKNNKFNLPTIDIIDAYLQSNQIINLPVFIIEFEKLKYCLETINQLKGLGVEIDTSSYLNYSDIKTVDQINEFTSYSFINK